MSEKPRRLHRVSASNETLICFAVKEEARPFQKLSSGLAVRTLVTGMGAANAERALTRELDTRHSRLVISAGFAGGLSPELAAGTVIFSSDAEHLAQACRQSGALRARFHCAQHVATTVAEKRRLREETGADAVEMESGIIERLCGERRIVHATVRVLLDAAGEDLPLDFNALMNARHELAPGKLAMALVKRPRKVFALLGLQKRSAAAAWALARVLMRVIEA
jgi:nucleoside phosphorylase